MYMHLSCALSIMYIAHTYSVQVDIIPRRGHDGLAVAERFARQSGFPEEHSRHDSSLLAHIIGRILR